MSKQDKEQGVVLLREKIAECFYYFHDWDGKTKWEDVNERGICYDFADQILAKAREAVKGAELKLNRGGILSDMEVKYYNNGAEAQTQAILKALEGE